MNTQFLYSRLVNLERQMPKIIISETEPSNPQEGVLYIIPKPKPMPVTDCYMRFDAMELNLANGAKVASWPDLSGNGNDIEQTDTDRQPEFLVDGLNGKPTVKFNFDWLENTSFSLDNTEGATIFMVTETDDTTRSNNPFVIAENMPAGGVTAISFRISGSSQTFNLVVNEQVTPVASTTNGGNLYTASYDVSQGGSIYKDGVLEGSGPAVGAIGAHNLFRIGAGPGADSFYYNGRVSEFIYFQRALSQSEIDEMNAYLINKWGI